MFHLKNQVIIAIDREFASGGKEIATILARELQLPLYDHNIIDLLKQNGTILSTGFKQVDESPRSRLFSRTVRGFTNSNENALAMMEFDFLKEKAREGSSFIVLGHCANEILKKNPGLISLFISADSDFKYDRARNVEKIPEDEVETFVHKKNRDRKTYHNDYCASKWGDSRHYDLCLKSNALGIENSADFILDFLKLRFQEMKSSWEKGN